MLNTNEDLALTDKGHINFLKPYFSFINEIITHTEVLKGTVLYFLDVSEIF